MKTISINVSEPVYAAFQEEARRRDRTAAELIREAMELYLRQQLSPRTSLRDLRPVSLGGLRKPLNWSDDLLEEMLG
jgi:hypothetical protein